MSSFDGIEPKNSTSYCYNLLFLFSSSSFETQYLLSMVHILHSLTHCHPLFPFFTPSSSPVYVHNNLFFTKKLNVRRFFSSRLEIRAIPIIDQELLQILTESDTATGKSRNHLPAVRSYETDLACLTLIGSVDFNQALLAAAADGGDTANEHISAGTSTMVVEAVFPSGSDDHSTISTRLFLPAEMVKNKARKLGSRLAGSILCTNDTISKNILAMTFRQVVLQQLWSFKLTLFYPGAERNMEALENTREAQAGFVINSIDEIFISSLAEVVCRCALQSSKSNYIQEVNYLKSTSQWFWNPPKSAIGSPISICRISEDEVVKEAMKQVETYKLIKGKHLSRTMKEKYAWWLPSDYSRLDLIGGSGFGSWTCEFIPAYRLQIDANSFKDVKFEGWHSLEDNRWEAVLTHFQMVDLVNILDMYYEDRYTIPNKKLLCDVHTSVSITLNSKNKLWKLLFAGGCAFLIFSILAQLCWRKHARKVPELKTVRTLSELNCFHLNSLECAEVEALCTAIISKIKDGLDWAGDLMVDKTIGAWIGALPSYLRNMEMGDPSDSCDLKLQKDAPDIACYQAVFTRDGKLIGFQPTNRVAVNQWSSNPLAKSLYCPQKLSPGLMEPRLDIPRPSDAIPIELLMSINPESRFALARPMQ